MKGVSAVVGALFLVLITISATGIAYFSMSEYLSDRSHEIDKRCIYPKIRIISATYPVIVLEADGVEKGHLLVVKGSKYCDIPIEVNKEDIVDASEQCLITKPEKIVVYSDDCEIHDTAPLMYPR